MKLPRRQFLHLAAGTAALPGCRVSLGRKPIRRGRCVLSLAFLPANQPTSANACSANAVGPAGAVVVIDNRPGVAGITIGTEAVVKAAAATSATLYDRLLNSRRRAGCGDQP